MPKFEIGQKVRVKSLGKVGEIRGYKIEGYILKGNSAEVTTYQLNFGSYFNDWFKEADIELYNSYEFNDKFEAGLKNFLIDIYLLHKKLDVVKLLTSSDKA